jgi:hypothetical protein
LYREIEQLISLYICSAVFTSMARPQPDLLKVGLEGFNMIDDISGRPRRPAGKMFAHKVLCPPKQEPVITSEEAAKRFGGVLITERFTGKGNRSFV